MENRKKKSGFTLVEVMVVFMVIAIIVVIYSSFYKLKNESSRKFFYYAALTNLQKVSSAMLAQGFDDPDVAGVTIEAKLPAKGHYDDNKSGFCDRFSNMVSTIGSLSSIDCTRTTTTNFNGSNTNFIVTNGARFYNLGSNPDGNGNYTVYVDINGPDENSLNSVDVMDFTIVRNSGIVLPAKTSPGANNTDYLAAAIRYKDANNKTQFLKHNITYREAFCSSGRAEIVEYTEYCAGYSNLAQCQGTNNSCEVALSNPGTNFLIFKIN